MHCLSDLVGPEMVTSCDAHKYDQCYTEVGPSQCVLPRLLPGVDCVRFD